MVVYAYLTPNKYKKTKPQDVGHRPCGRQWKGGCGLEGQTSTDVGGANRYGGADGSGRYEYVVYAHFIPNNHLTNTKEQSVPPLTSLRANFPTHNFL